jgi:hypothetical protein
MDHGVPVGSSLEKMHRLWNVAHGIASQGLPRGPRPDFGDDHHIARRKSGGYANSRCYRFGQVGNAQPFSHQSRLIGAFDFNGDFRFGHELLRIARGDLEKPESRPQPVLAGSSPAVMVHSRSERNISGRIRAIPVRPLRALIVCGARSLLSYPASVLIRFTNTCDYLRTTGRTRSTGTWSPFLLTTFRNTSS